MTFDTYGHLFPSVATSNVAGFMASLRLRPTYPSPGMRPPIGIAALHAKNAVPTTKGNTSGWSLARRAHVALRELCYR